MHWFGDLTMKPTEDQGFLDLRIWPPKDSSDEAARPTFMMVKVSNLLAEKGPLSQRVICDVLKGKTETKRQALSHLISGGYVTPKTPHSNIKPFTKDTQDD